MSNHVMEGEIRLVIGLLNEAERVSPGVPRVELARRFGGRRDFESRLVEGRVTPRRMAYTAGGIADFLARYGG